MQSLTGSVGGGGKNAHHLAKALSAKLKADPRFSLDRYLVHPPKPRTGAGGPSGDSAPPKIAAADIGDHDIAKVKALLKAEFVAADREWRQWEPVEYAGGPRPKNPKNPKNHIK